MSAAVPAERAVPAARGADRRQFVLGGALLATVAATWMLRPRQVASRLQPGMLDRAVPRTIGRYRFLTESGLVLPPADEISERIYDQVLTRVYAVDGNQPVMLLIAYGSAQDYTLQAHLPEVCYPSSGYTLTDLSRVPVALARAREQATFLTAERADRIEQVFYWTRIGSRFPATLTDERLAVIGSNLAGVLPDGVLVRISTLSPDRVTALGELQDFNRALVAAIGPLGRRLLLGRQA